MPYLVFVIGPNKTNACLFVPIHIRSNAPLSACGLRPGWSTGTSTPNKPTSLPFGCSNFGDFEQMLGFDAGHPETENNDLETAG